MSIRRAERQSRFRDFFFSKALIFYKKITLDKVAKYYGVSYTGTGIDFGYKYSGKQVARLVRGADFVLGHRTPSAPVLCWDKDKSRVSSQGYAVVVVLVSKVNQLQVRRLEAE